MKTCATCNASHKNTVDRVLRCMGCVARASGNSNWRPLVPNAKGVGLAGIIGESHTTDGLCHGTDNGERT
jgi:hypothetical protein